MKPTLSELEIFEDTPENIDLELPEETDTGAIEKTDSPLHSFSTGDKVEVCEGELMNLQGKILSIDGNVIKVLPDHKELPDPLEFPANELRKFFTVGDHAKVTCTE